MTFSEAFEQIRNSKDISMNLPHWSKEVKIQVQLPTPKNRMTAPYLFVKSKNGIIPWMPTIIELFSDKWEINKHKDYYLGYKCFRKS